MTITLRKEGLRTYFCGNTFPVKDQIKGIGGKWDGAVKAWWIDSQRRAEAETLIAEISAETTRAAAALPALTGTLVPVKGNTYAARGALRDLGASWDAASKSWMVDASRLTLAQDAVAAAASKDAAPRAPSAFEREIRGQFEQAQVERVAALKRLDEAREESKRAGDAFWAAEDPTTAVQWLADTYAAEQAAEQAAREATDHESLALYRIKSHEARQMPREPYRYIRGW